MGVVRAGRSVQSGLDCEGLSLMRDVLHSLDETPLYDAAAARELLMVVGPPDDASDIAEAIAHVLSEIGKSAAFDLYREGQASTPQREKSARALRDACQK